MKNGSTSYQTHKQIRHNQSLKQENKKKEEVLNKPNYHSLVSIQLQVSGCLSVEED